MQTRTAQRSDRNMKKRIQQALCGVLLCALLMPGLTTPAGAISFTDVPPNHWTAPSIHRCVELGFFLGETETTFGLGHEMTRAAFAVVLSRFFGWETPTVTESSYDDVEPDAWYAPAVEAALREGAFALQTKEFRPQDSLTREEMAVMLVRVLGYHELAGLAQELPLQFEDVTTNPGYIALSQEMELVKGTTATSFAPNRAATREEVAVTLVRLYDKLHTPAPGKVGVVTSAEELTDMTGFDAVAVYGGQIFIQSGKAKLVSGMAAEEIAVVREKAKAAGAKQLLQVTGYTSFLSASPKDTAKTLAAAVTEGGYDGLYLDVKELNSRKNPMTNLVTALREQLGTRLLYVAVEAPSWRGRTYEGYDYSALGQQADRLVLRLTPVETKIGGVPVAPKESLEEVYYALSVMNNRVDMKKVSLMLTTTADVWHGTLKTKTLSGTALEQLAEENGLKRYESARYGCSYLSGILEKKQATAWYLDGAAVAERVKLLNCFGVDQICLSTMNGVSADLLAGLQ